VRWRLLLEEFGPKLTHVKGTNNIVADVLDRLETAEEELSAEAFANELANEEEDFPTDILSPTKKQPFIKRKTECCKTSSGHNPNCTLRSRTLFQTARASSLLRTTRFVFLSRCNASVSNGVT